MESKIAAFAKRLYDSVESASPDFIAVNLRFLQRHKRFARLRNPRSFSDHVTYRTLFEHDPRFVTLSDKIAAKEYVAEKLGLDWIIPTLWSGDRLPPRGLRTWPAPFVLKASHGSSWNCFVRKPVTDWTEIEELSQRWLGWTYGDVRRERHYDEIAPRLLVEPLVGDPAELPTDFKFFVFGGRVHFITAQSDRHVGMRIAVHDRNWTPLPFRLEFDQPAEPPQPPSRLKEMVDAAEVLGRGFDFVRIDLYEIAGEPKFGEFTFTPGSGLWSFQPESYDLLFGRRWTDARKAHRGFRT